MFSPVRFFSHELVFFSFASSRHRHSVDCQRPKNICTEQHENPSLRVFTSIGQNTQEKERKKRTPIIFVLLSCTKTRFPPPRCRLHLSNWMRGKNSISPSMKHGTPTSSRLREKYELLDILPLFSSITTIITMLIERHPRLLTSFPHVLP